MFGDSVYAYHDNATQKNDASCPLPGSWSMKSLVIIAFEKNYKPIILCLLKDDIAVLFWSLHSVLFDITK